MNVSLLPCRVTALSTVLLFLQVLVAVGSINAAEARSFWQAEWEKVVKAAEEEGQVRIYASNSVGNLQVIWDAFQRRYPRIKLTGAAVGRGSDMVPKLMAERRAGKYLADVFLGAPSAIYINFYRAKILEPIPPALILPEVTDLSKWWQGKHHYVDLESQYIFMYESSLYGPQISYNTKLVKPEEITSVWDVLHPKWKGKFEAAHIGPTQGSTAIVFLYHHPQIGPKFLEKLYGEMDVTLFGDFRQATDWLAQGKFSLCLLCRRIDRAAAQGLPVAELNPYDLKEKPGIGAGSGAIGLMNRHPHANAAKVFINWYLSREGQIAFRQANTDEHRKASLREDLLLDIVPELARRRQDKEYVFINRPEWMDEKPIHALLERVIRKHK